MHSPGPADNQECIYPDLLLKLGSVVVELDARREQANQGDKGDKSIDGKGDSVLSAEAALTEGELWCVRECAKSTVMYGNEAVGISLLVKAYKGLLEARNEKELSGVGLTVTPGGTAHDRKYEGDASVGKTGSSDDGTTDEAASSPNSNDIPYA